MREQPECQHCCKKPATLGYHGGQKRILWQHGSTCIPLTTRSRALYMQKARISSVSHQACSNGARVLLWSTDTFMLTYTLGLATHASDMQRVCTCILMALKTWTLHPSLFQSRTHPYLRIRSGSRARMRMPFRLDASERRVPHNCCHVLRRFRIFCVCKCLWRWEHRTVGNVICIDFDHLDYWRC